MTTPTDTETTNDCIKSETLVEMSNNASNDKKANEKDDAGVIVTYNSSTANNDHNFFEETCYNLANLLLNLEDTAQVAACGTIAGALLRVFLCDILAQITSAEMYLLIISCFCLIYPF